MTPEHFSNLKDGDVISDDSGMQWTVLGHISGDVIAQRVSRVPYSKAPSTKLIATLVQDLIPKREYPPLFIMQRDLFAAGYLKVEGATGEFWKTGPGVVEHQFRDINCAFDWLQGHPTPPTPFIRPRTPRPPTLPEMRNALKSAGWTLRPGARVLWQCPFGIPYGNTHFSYRVMKSWEKD